MQLARRGDKAAIDQLLDRHRDRLKRMVTVRMDDRLSARFDPSDVVQETLINATRLLPRFSRNHSGSAVLNSCVARFFQRAYSKRTAGKFWPSRRP